MASKIDKIIEVLKDLESTAPDIEASAVVSDDGFIIASVLPTDVDEDRVGAMSATMLALGERAAGELDRGGLDQVFVKGSNGYVIMSFVGTSAVLTTMASKDAKLGLVFLEMKRATEELLKHL
ncbi:MAG: roadblock/LC7 domain-containing protein [Candidatus Aminicenantes bacterium]|nr:roadblock/LC7 domain-containing protein [Candidatus Aminicenantes bacterium]